MGTIQVSDFEMIKLFCMIALGLFIEAYEDIYEGTEVDDFYAGGLERFFSSFPSNLDRSSDNEVVTVTAKFWYVSDFEKENPEAQADSYVDAINQAFKDSKIPINYKRWGSVEKVPITHAQFSSPRRSWQRSAVFLNAFGDNEEGRQRLKESADHMVIMVNQMYKAYSCVNFAPWADPKYKDTYATISVTYDDPGLFAHEAGHCLGAMHDRYTTNSMNKKDKDYNHGYCLPNSKYATIMSIKHNCPAPERQRILYYSNPDVSYEGIPTGDERHNNARMIREQRKYKSTIGSNCMVKDGSGRLENRCKLSEWSGWGEWTQCCCDEDYTKCPLACKGNQCFYLYYKQKRSKTRTCVNALNEPTKAEHCGGAEGEQYEKRRCRC